jgi:hypothetical protein
MLFRQRLFSRLLASFVLMAGAASVGVISKAAKAKVSVRPAKKEVRKKTLPTARAKLRKPAAAARKVNTAAGGK